MRIYLNTKVGSELIENAWNLRKASDETKCDFVIFDNDCINLLVNLKARVAILDCSFENMTVKMLVGQALTIVSRIFTKFDYDCVCDFNNMFEIKF